MVNGVLGADDVAVEERAVLEEGSVGAPLGKTGAGN